MVVVEERDVNFFFFIEGSSGRLIYLSWGGELTKLQIHYNNCYSSKVAAVEDIFWGFYVIFLMFFGGRSAVFWGTLGISFQILGCYWYGVAFWVCVHLSGVFYEFSGSFWGPFVSFCPFCLITDLL